MDRPGLTPFYRKLIALRRDHPALRSRAVEILAASPADRVIAYVRPGAPPVLVVVNLAGAPLEARVETPLGPRFRDVLHDEAVVASRDGGALRIALPADGVRLLVP